MQYIIDIPEDTPCIHIYKTIDFFHFDVTAIPVDQLTPYTESERKKGHWIYCDEYDGAVTHICSECGKRMTTAIGVKASFCWNCGADMREGEEE